MSTELWTKDTKTSSKKEDKKEERKNSSDPYENWQDSDKESERRANMLAKEAEIAAPGNFTKEEAEKIKQGLDINRAAEVDSQVLPEAKDSNRVNLFNSETSESISLLMSELSIGRNEKRAQIRSLRQKLQDIEVKMDQNLI